MQGQLECPNVILKQPIFITIISECIEVRCSVLFISFDSRNGKGGSADNRGFTLDDIVSAQTYSKAHALWKDISHFIENYRQDIFFVVLFMGVSAVIFAERFYCECSTRMSQYFA